MFTSLHAARTALMIAADDIEEDTGEYPVGPEWESLVRDIAVQSTDSVASELIEFEKIAF